MTKVSIGFRGWRFDEDEVFDENGDYRPLKEMSEDTRERLGRLPLLADRPCDACYLSDGESDNSPTAVYGEPGAEVLVCDDHEPEFYYWFLEDGGDEHRGTETLQDAFHEWFAAGNRAPDWYDGPDHVETEPENLPEPDLDNVEAVNVELPEDEQSSVDLRDVEESLRGADIEMDYPTADE
ncbi:hypothetical protein [Halobacterium wangiae]|uniref:hypothetical protein n=1 Tax=Halobacterium wangiae TaxID=2902623 RepID=UPI001E2F9A6F|nr:hypothetical protein [Halobacterium wangiae]